MPAAGSSEPKGESMQRGVDVSMRALATHTNNQQTYLWPYRKKSRVTRFPGE